MDRSGPSSLPGSINSGKIARVVQVAGIIRQTRVRCAQLSNCVVEALVRSPARRPVKSQPKRSGIMSSVSATSNSGERDCAKAKSW